MLMLTLQFAEIWMNKSTLHKFVKHMHTAEKTPAFVPGKVLYIRERKPGRRIHRRYRREIFLHVAMVYS